ncbi:MAG: hypothetical protein ABEJ66_03205, partial [Candidatus Nanohaloarchaea archaeon]
DGVIEPGSLDKLYDRFDGSNIVSGREVPVPGNSFTEALIDKWRSTHDRICRYSSRFSTHLGILPAGLVDRFPKDILDDIYIEWRARKKGLEREYVEEAVKYHHMPGSLYFFYRQQLKNWKGRLYAEERGYTHSKPAGLLAETFLEEAKNSPVSELPETVSLALIEAAAYIAAVISGGDPPKRWYRPG